MPRISETRESLSSTFAPRRSATTIAYLGDSLSVASSVTHITTHWASVAHALCGARYSHGYQGGVGGETSSQIAARVSAVTATSPTWCIVHAGVNDLAAGATSTAVIANLQTIITALRAARVRPIICTIIPSSSITTSAHLLQTGKVNSWIRALPASQGVDVIDWRGAVVDWSSATAQWTAAWTTDGVHPNDLGSLVLGGFVANRLMEILPAKGDNLLVDADTTGRGQGLLSANPGMTGSGGTAGTGVTGTIPAGWTVSTGGATATACSVVPRTDGVGGNWLSLNITAGSPYVFTQNTAVGVDWAVGETVYAEVEILMDTTPVKTRRIALTLDFWNAIGQVLNTVLAAPAATELPLVGRSQPIVLRTTPTVIPASTARLQFKVEFVESAASQTSTFKVGRACIRRVAA